jgi:hypothetical protein
VIDLGVRLPEPITAGNTQFSELPAVAQHCDDQDVDRSSTPRVLVDWTLVLALVTAAFTGWAGTAHRTVPPELVGAWHAAAAGHWNYRLTADGHYRAWSHGAVNTGTFTADGTTITFSNGGAPVTGSWSVGDGRLVLDGDAYVRA